MARTFFLEDIDQGEENVDIETFILNNLLIEDEFRNSTEFDSELFRMMLYTEESNEIVHRVLDYFELRDMDVTSTYENSYIDDFDEQQFAKYYKDHFLDDFQVNYGFYKMKTKFFVLWSVTSFWMKETGKNQFGENGRGRIRDRKEFEEFSVDINVK